MENVPRGLVVTLKLRKRRQEMLMRHVYGYAMETFSVLRVALERAVIIKGKITLCLKTLRQPTSLSTLHEPLWVRFPPRVHQKPRDAYVLSIVEQLDLNFDVHVTNRKSQGQLRLVDLNGSTYWLKAALEH